MVGQIYVTSASKSSELSEEVDHDEGASLFQTCLLGLGDFVLYISEMKI